MNKRWSLHLVFFLFITCHVFGQDPGFDTTVDRYANVTRIQNSLSNKFTVGYHNWYKVITNISLNQSYVVTYKGQPHPPQPIGDPPFINVTIDSSKVTIGVNGANVVLSYLELLGLEHKVQYSNDPASITSNCYEQNLSANNASSLIFSNSTTSASPGGATIIGFSPDDTMTPLERASWIMYISYFFDMENEANNIYVNNIQRQYFCHKGNVEKSGPKTIAVTQYINNQWTLLQNSSRFYSTLISEAGMTPFSGDITHLHESDFVIDISPSSSFPNNFDSWLQLIGKYDTNIQTFTNLKNVYSTDGLTNNEGVPDWPERSPSRPDLAIQDVIHMVYPQYNINYLSTWLRNFAKGDMPRRTKLYYPTCDSIPSIFPGGCLFHSYTPGDSNSGSDQGVPGGSGSEVLSTSGKIGVAVSVVVAIVVAGALGFFLYRKKQENPDHTFYKMNDI